MGQQVSIRNLQNYYRENTLRHMLELSNIFPYSKSLRNNEQGRLLTKQMESVIVHKPPVMHYGLSLKFYTPT